MAASKPFQVRVRMYQVGFGDCFLVLFDYKKPLGDGRSQRSILIDFGSSHGPEGRSLKSEEVARRIAADCGGKLDVVVVTHRHKDHLSAFGSSKPGQIIEDLNPDLVVRPWTEHPNLEADAGEPMLGARSIGFRRALDQAQAFAGTVAESPLPGRGLAGDLKAMAVEELKNLPAIERLDRMASGHRGRYVFAGSDSGIAGLIPGITVSVLGPPTLEQSPEIEQQVESHEEFWMLYQGLALSRLPAAAAEDALAPRLGAISKKEVPPGPARWLAEHLERHQLHSILRVVRRLDDALNNTSVILLIEAGKKRMLFPGDAQIENWKFTLDRLAGDPKLKKRLSEVDLYKVGHHGSRNATPRSLFALWNQGTAATRPMAGIMSTRPGVHGESEATAVPRSSLVTALEQRMPLFVSTHVLAAGTEVVELVGRTTVSKPVVRKP
jgi:hypothetical protein